MATVTHPASTSTIVGAVVGSLTGIAILTIVLYYILRRKSRDTEQAYYFEKPYPIDIAINECTNFIGYLTQNAEALRKFC